MCNPEVTHRGALDMQVCAPEHWDNDQVLEFAERSGFVHIMLDA